jgi:glyoxylase-like metal-dependent hydrolase (beta-lactamase superfamily II)
MRRRPVLLAGVSCMAFAAMRGLAVLAGVSVRLPLARAAPHPGALEAAADALGVNEIKTLQFIASGTNFTVGQNFTPNDPWPPVPVKSYKVLINYETGSMQQELVREMGATMPRGGGVPFTGELRQITAVNEDYAWNVPVSATPSSGAPPATCCSLPEAGSTSPAGPAPDSRVLCRLMLWSMPQGFVKAAMANNATVTRMKDGAEVSFTIDGKYKMIGIINAQDQVERVRTWISQSIVGDMLVETQYSGYTDFGGTQFPSHIVQKQDGFPSLDLTVASVTANPAFDITVPDNVRNAPRVPPVTVDTQKLADGVFWLTGGTHHSLAIEMKDHIVLVDTPNGEARALAVITKAKEVIPGKPIRYMIAMHHHWDHLGGIRTAIDEGATIVTHETNKAFLERAATAPHTIDPDRLSMSKKPLKLQTVGDEATLTDGARTIKLYAMIGFEHTADMLMVYLPNEKVLAEADAYTPPETPSTPIPAPRVPYAAALYDNVQRLKLDVQTIAPFHGARTHDLAEVAMQGGR